MKLKYFVFCILFSAVSPRGFAQENTGIHFTESSWQQLLAQARQEHKLIFMDAHTTWCGPCKWMDKNVFPDPNVSALYNRNFINAYTDMEKGEGIELRKKYAVRAYPTYLFINGDGEVVHRTVGESTIPEFIQYGLDALSPTRNLQFFQKNYAGRSSDYHFVSGYLNALLQAYETDTANAIALEYLQKQQTSSLLSHENWELLHTYVLDASSPVFRYLVDHQGAFEKLYGPEEVSKTIYSTYLQWPRHYLHFPEGSKAFFDTTLFDQFLSQVKKSHYDKKNDIIARSELTVYSGMRNYTPYTGVVSRMLKDHLIPNTAQGAEQLYSYADMVYRFAKDNPVALEAAAAFAKMTTERFAGITGQHKAEYQELYADLLDESGKKDEAALVRKSIDQKKLTQAQESNPFQQMRIAPKQNSK
jgi:thiol-disulfide isomerase/thioredoxin